ncbi:9413_t:CDS:2, partial [Rhizophagus irregularis]
LFTEQTPKLNRKKGNSLYCNLPPLQNTRRTTPRPRLCERSVILPSWISNEFPPLPSSIKNSSGNIRQDFQNRILPIPRRGTYPVLTYSLPTNFKYLKREIVTPSEKIRLNEPPPLNFLPIPTLQPRSRSRRISRHQPNIHRQLTRLVKAQDAKLEKSNRLKRFVCCALIKLFISNSATLNTFEIILHRKNDKHGFDFMYDVYEMIKNNSKFISEVENFTFHYSLPPYQRQSFTITESKRMSILPLITFLPSLCNLIKNLKIQVIPNFSFEASKNLSKFIGSQKQLSKLTFTFNKEVFQDSLSNLKSVAHTLTCLIFDSCHFTNIQSFQGLEYLENLESLQFFHCYPVLKLEIVQHLSEIKNLRIKTLAIVNNNNYITRGNLYIDILQYQLLLHKIGSHLENLILSIDFDIKKDIFQSILHYCEKIKFIHFTKLNHDNIPDLNDLILNFSNTLKYLTLDIDCIRITTPYMEDDDSNVIQNMKKTSTLLLQQLGQLLPPTLEYIDLFLIIDPINLEIFLNNIKHIKNLKKLLLRNSREFYLDENLKLLKDFIIEMFSIKYFSYRIGKGADTLEWDLGGNNSKEKEKSKEFESFVKVRKYSEVMVRMTEPFYNDFTANYALKFHALILRSILRNGSLETNDAILLDDDRVNGLNSHKFPYVWGEAKKDSKTQRIEELFELGSSVFNHLKARHDTAISEIEFKGLGIMCTI